MKKKNTYYLLFLSEKATRIEPDNIGIKTLKQPYFLKGRSKVVIQYSHMMHLADQEMKKHHNC